MTGKIAFFEEWSWLKFNNFGLALGKNLTFCTSVVKGLKLKVRKFRGPNPAFVEVTREKLVGGPFCLPPSWIGLNLGSFWSYFWIWKFVKRWSDIKSLGQHDGAFNCFNCAFPINRFPDELVSKKPNKISRNPPFCFLFHFCLFY